MRQIYKKILESKIFIKKPIVLCHIGSAGENFQLWQKIQKNSILISIDPNVDCNKKNFLQTRFVNKIISSKNGTKNFYITKDPDCSSLLYPKKSVFTNWYGAHRFKLIKIKKVNVFLLNSILKDLNIKYIDWLVIDTQGTDLTIFKSIAKKIKSKISIVDLEAVIFEFYKNADKLSDVFSYMQKYFEFKDMNFGYNYKVKNNNISILDKKVLFRFDNPSKIYSNITFINKDNKSERIFLFKIIYLILNNKFFEAKSLLMLNKRIKISQELIKIINYRIIFNKIMYFFLIPFFLLQKMYNKILINK